MKTKRTILQPSAIRLGVPWLLALVLAAGVTGCVVPLPLLSPMENHGARTNLTQNTAQEFKAGQSSMADVVLALGEPDVVSADGYKLAYHSEKAPLPVVVVVYPLGGAIYTKELFCTFEFDPQGCLQKATQSQKTRLGDFNGEDDMPIPKWPYGDTNYVPAYMIERGHGQTNYVPAWLAGERLWRVFPETKCYTGVNGFQGLQARIKEMKVGMTLAWGGWLILTESNVFLFSKAQFANAEPMVKIPLASVTGVWVDEQDGERMLVVRSEPGQVNSFILPETKPGLFHRVDKDRQPARVACDLIQSKIKPASSEP